MAASDPAGVTQAPRDAVTALLDRWGAVLEAWLHTGAAAPAARARLELAELMGCAAMADWPEAQRLAKRLLGEAEGAERAAALLDLWVWAEGARRLHDAERIAGGE